MFWLSLFIIVLLSWFSGLSLQKLCLIDDHEVIFFFLILIDLAIIFKSVIQSISGWHVAIEVSSYNYGFVNCSFSSISFYFSCFVDPLFGAYIFSIAVSSWWIDHYIMHHTFGKTRPGANCGMNSLLENSDLSWRK